MTMASEKSLCDVPTEIFQKNLSHYLDLDELLRVRQVCKTLKGSVDAYLRIAAKIPKRVVINLDEFPLEDFLEGSNNSLEGAASRFKILFTSSRIFRIYPSVQHFLAQFGNPIVEMEVSVVGLPMAEYEVSFYRKLPNLRNLTVNKIKEGSFDQVELEELKFPENFKKLKCLRIVNFFGMDGMGSTFLKLFEFCTKLQHFQIPNVFDPRRLRTEELRYQRVRQLQQILGKKEHKMLKFLQLASYEGDRDWDMGSIQNFNFTRYLAKMCLDNDLKLVRMSAAFISRIPAAHLELIAPQVNSIAEINSNSDFRGITFPNVEEVYKLDWSSKSATISETLFPGIFPALKRLCIVNRCGVNIPSMTYLWESFPNLEELEIFQAQDEMFLSDKEGSTAFLKLTNLKKLMIRTSTCPRARFTDAVFHQVFRRLRLREFYLESIGPAQSFPYITRAGVEALLTGPFMETIQLFPFRRWGVEGVSEEEFQQLARQFPCNQ